MNVAGSVGVVDTGVVLTVLDPQRRAHTQAAGLFDASDAGRLTLHISSVNLAEILQQARAGIRASGLDPVTFLSAFKVTVHRPDIDVARAAAALRMPRLSLADRFAAATAQVLGARLHTTDGTLASALRARRVPVTLY